MNGRAPATPATLPKDRLRLRVAVGLFLLGYAGLVAAGITPHESAFIPVVAAVLGALCLAGARVSAPRARPLPTALTGLCVLTFIAVENRIRGSGLGRVEGFIVVYAAFLVAASPFLREDGALHRLPAMVGLSAFLGGAPVALFAFNALVSRPGAPIAAAPAIGALLVRPVALCLNVAGIQASVAGTNLTLATGAGTLTLGVGLVCAGLYPFALFASVLGYDLWHHRLPFPTALAMTSLGTVGIWAMDVVRILLLAIVGRTWGPRSLEAAHAHLGWLLFIAFAAAFWGVQASLPRPPAPDSTSASSARRPEPVRIWPPTDPNR